MISIDIRFYFLYYKTIMEMETPVLSRQKLESFSTQDLLDLADDYGIDIPEDLNRRFIIEEILESVEE